MEHNDIKLILQTHYTQIKKRRSFLKKFLYFLQVSRAKTICFLIIIANILWSINSWQQSKLTTRVLKCLKYKNCIIKL